MGGVIRLPGPSRSGSTFPPDGFSRGAAALSAAPLLLSARAAVTACCCQRAARPLERAPSCSRASSGDEPESGSEGSAMPAPHRAFPPRHALPQAHPRAPGEPFGPSLRCHPAPSPHRAPPPEQNGRQSSAAATRPQSPSGSQAKELLLTRQGGDAADRASPPMKKPQGQVLVLRPPPEPVSVPVPLWARELPEPGIQGPEPQREPRQQGRKPRELPPEHPELRERPLLRARGFRRAF